MAKEVGQPSNENEAPYFPWLKINSIPGSPKRRVPERNGSIVPCFGMIT